MANIGKVKKINHKVDKEEIRKLYKTFFSENKEIYLLAGELNPSFYKRLIEDCFPFDKDSSINIICGPFISVEDDLFRQYHDIHDNHLGNWWYAKRKGDWWKMHPVFEKAYLSGNINIYVIKQRYEPHFLIGLDQNLTLVEEPHDELDESEATIYYNDQKRTQELLKKWNNFKSKCYKWNEKSDKRLFKPVYKIKRELELGKNIEKEFSTPMALST